MNNEEFNKWWNSDEPDGDHPYKRDTPLYWAWAGWQAGVKAERKRCHEFLMNLHMQAGGKHNYYHVAANQLLE